MGIIAIPLSLLNPYLTKLVIDKAYAQKDIKLFLILAIAGGVVFVFQGLINSLSDYLAQRINQAVRFDLTKDIFRHLQSLPLSFFQDKSTGEHIYKIISDVSSVSNFICMAIPQIIALFPRLLFILAIVFYLNWKLALFCFLLIPFMHIHPYFFGKRLKEMARWLIEKSEGIFTKLQEVFTHIHLIKAQGKDDYEIKQFEKTLSETLDFEVKNAKLLSISNFFAAIMGKVITGIIALYAGYQVIKGTITLGSLTAVMIYLIQLIGLTESIHRFYEMIMINSVSCQRLAEILDIQPPQYDKEDAIDYPILRGNIEFKRISFGYRKDEFILKEMSFSITAGSHIALVGPSGCGKTTLLSLILRLYEPQIGYISIDDVDIKEIKLKSLKEQIGIALQEPFLWNDTVKHNLLYTKEDASMDEVIEAARIAEAHNFILGFAKGYDTIIGENACKLSEGQKQRIAIARAVIKRPKILIFDEAMSSLDSDREEKIIDNIKREFKDSTLLIVSHRLSTVRKMDLVYFLVGPSQIESGTHEELIERNLKYRELFASQIKKTQESEIML